MLTIDWGLIDYEEAVEKQLLEVQKVQSGDADRLILCQHPPVVTLGRSSKDYDLVGWQGSIVETTRGGRATYHGPSQLVIYPIVNLNNSKRDVHAYLRKLEEVVMEVLSHFNISSQIRSERTLDSQGNTLEVTGVWVEDRKIASIGIAVKKWVTYHGVAINALDDPKAFSGINPCGFHSSVMTNIEKECGTTLSMSDLKSIVKKMFSVKTCNA